MPVKPKHYQNFYTRSITKLERDTGMINIKFDPYRIGRVLNIGGGAREQILKKAIRWTNKGCSERKVIKEIMQACERHLELLDEDNQNG